MDIHSATFDNDVMILNKAIDRLEKYGWIKGIYSNQDGQCCMIGAIDEWSNEDVDDDNYVPHADPSLTCHVKIALAKKIKEKYSDIYADFRNIVEAGYTIHSRAYMEDETWAEATVMQFNDHPLVQFEDVMQLLNEVIADYE